MFNFICLTFYLIFIRHTIVIFTKTDNLDENQTPEGVIRQNAKLSELQRKTNNRWVGFNNKEPTGDEPEEVMETVELMLACNDGQHYSSSLYTRVAKRLTAYGAGTVAEMRAMADDHPWIMLAIVGILLATPALGVGYLVAGATFVTGFFTISYERYMGRDIVETPID